MHSTHISPIPRAIVQRDEAGARLNWLLAANEDAAQRRKLFRSGAEEEQMLLMRRPVSTEKAYALFGMLLGALPPAVIFSKLFGYGMTGGSARESGSAVMFFILSLVMNVLCCLAGNYLGAKVSRMVQAIERDSWTKMLLESPLVGAIWGAGTGAIGGFFFFGIGAFFGAACAAAVGALAFVLFTPLHRLLERGGMIETRHFLPLACGITLTIAALISGL